MKTKCNVIGIFAFTITVLVVALILYRCTSADPRPGNPGGGAFFELFEAEDCEYTLMYGAPATWDDEKNLNVDLDKDGISEEFIITKDKRNKIVLQGIARTAQGQIRTSFHFWNADLRRLLPDILRSADSVSAQTFIQISCCDIDADGIKEVLISVGDKQNANLTAVYEYRQSGQAALFQYSGSILCDMKVEYTGDHILRAYSGDGSYTAYRYENETILK